MLPSRTLPNYHPYTLGGVNRSNQIVWTNTIKRVLAGRSFSSLMSSSRVPLIAAIVVFGTILLIATSAFNGWNACQTMEVEKSVNHGMSAGVHHAHESVYSTEVDLVDPATESFFKELDHLILVPGHAVLSGIGPISNPNSVKDGAVSDSSYLSSDRAWVLLPYQHGQVSALLGHIELGVTRARQEKRSLLIFSGGETRRTAGPRSEAQSYWMAAEYMKWWNNNKKDETDTDAGSDKAESTVEVDPVSLRATTEEYARDSFENLLFSLCRFREVVGRYPQHITVIGFEFKRMRFEEIHRRAIRFPKERFHYIGIDPADTRPSEVGDIRARQRRQQLYESEQRSSVEPFQSDPYGCIRGGVLRLKKSKRNPFQRHHAYEHSCPELEELFKWCQKEMFQGTLPWDQYQTANSVIQGEGEGESEGRNHTQSTSVPAIEQTVLPDADIEMKTEP